MTLNVVLLAILCAWIAWRARPPAGSVRLRNAWLVDRGDTSDFAWTPECPPAGFRVERHPPDPYFVGIVQTIAGADDKDDWKRALCIATHLVEHARDQGALRSGLRATYEGIRAGYGYCADFARVYVALAHAAKLGVRQWGFSFDGFGGHGHTVVEVFDRRRARWLMLDVYNNLHVVDDASGEPLGALEYRDALLGKRGPARMVPNGGGRPGFVHEATAIEYYRRGLAEWYLLWSNDVYTYDAQPVVRALERVSRTLAQVAASALRLQPRLRIVGTSANDAAVRRMFALRRELFAIGTIGALLVAALAVELGLAMTGGTRP